jgi:predicted secreted Zn-dependent protease
MKPGLLAALFVALAVPAAAGGWTPAERVETYAVQGATGLDLYRSIGARGPEIGGTRTIAYTTFDLKWSRDYRPQPDGSCRLVTARPHLTIITKLPKPAGRLAPALKARWQTFIDGIAAHERYHAETILDMVKAIEAYSVGLTVADDGKCRKIREVLTKRLGELSQEQRAKGRDFDRIEMSDGGNVHRLILGLVEE